MITNELAELVQTISHSGFKQFDCLLDIDEECWQSHNPPGPASVGRRKRRPGMNRHHASSSTSLYAVVVAAFAES